MRMLKKTISEHKKIVQSVLLNEYGFYPILKHISDIRVSSYNDTAGDKVTSYFFDISNIEYHIVIVNDKYSIERRKKHGKVCS